MNTLTVRLISITRNANLKNYTGALSPTEQIAVAFLLNDLSLLPADCDSFLDAWIQLDEWQNAVLYIHQRLMQLVFSTENVNERTL